MHKVIKREEIEKYLSWFPIFLVISGSGSPSGPVNLSFTNLEKNCQYLKENILEESPNFLMSSYLAPTHPRPLPWACIGRLYLLHALREERLERGKRHTVIAGGGGGDGAKKDDNKSTVLFEFILSQTNSQFVSIKGIIVLLELKNDYIRIDVKLLVYRVINLANFQERLLWHKVSYFV